MKVKAYFFLASLARVLAFSSQRAHGCVTTDDVSGGGYETSAATDLCGSGGFGGGYPPLQGMTKPQPQIPSSDASLLVGFSSALDRHHGAQLVLLAVFLGGFSAVVVPGLSIRTSRLSQIHEVAP